MAKIKAIAVKLVPYSEVKELQVDVVVEGRKTYSAREALWDDDFTPLFDHLLQRAGRLIKEEMAKQEASDGKTVSG